MAPLGPAPEMVSNDRSRSSGLSRRSASRWSDAVNSSSSPFGASSSTHFRKREMAAPSRAWAVFWPAISAAFLIALGSTVGSRRARILAPAFSSASKIAATARSGSTATVLPLSVARNGSNSDRSCSRTPLPRCWRTSASIFLTGDEQVGGAVGIDQRIGQRDRRAGDVGAADVERPGDRIERRQHRRVGAMLGQPVGDVGALFGRVLAGILVGLDDQVRLRRLGTVLPHRVDRVALDRHQLAPRAASASLACRTQSRLCSHGS